MNEVTNKEAVLTLLGGIGVAALIALLLLFGNGCIEIANVESFVTLPRETVPFGKTNER